MVHELHEKKKREADMDEEEKNEYDANQSMIKQLFRNDSEDIQQYYPIIIKAKESGVLETLLTETNKIIRGVYQITIVQTGVGPINEADLNAAIATGATILGFDIPVPGPIEARVADAGILIRLHKLIYKFTDDLNDLVHDVKLNDLRARGEGKQKNIVGSAQILQIFSVTAGKKEQTVYGSKIISGQLLSKNIRYQIKRFDDVIVDDLTLGQLKHHKKIVSQLEKGQECGISFELREELDLRQGDLIECYTLEDEGEEKFKHPPGVNKTY
jgi:translation initiation factor IF-2